MPKERALVKRGPQLAALIADLNDRVGWYVGLRCYVERHAGLQQLKDMFFSEFTLTYLERFRLTVFLLWNGVSPYHVLLWYDLRGLLRDSEAWRHVEYLIAEWNDGCRKWASHWTWCTHNDCWWDIGRMAPHQFQSRRQYA
jgi:hypothetical protein